ncbi:MAG: hypothetical protein KGN02_04290 [bacterium]|nr:hypothetical protein [bacterium]
MNRRIIAILVAALALLPLAARADQAGYLYSYGVDESRYGDIVFAIDAYKPLGSPDASLRPYVDVFANDDSKTANGAVPRIYSDNYAGGAFGLQFTNEKGLRLFAQVGATTTIGSIASEPSGGDLRGGVQLYREWGGARGAYGNFYGSGTYYSRYHDAVFYNQLELGTATGGAHRIEYYVRPVLTFDSHPYYYDNVAEITAGVRFHPFGTRGPTFALEEAAGTYLRGDLLPPDVARTYLDFRPTIAYGVSI